jgi:hypothetical protein
MPREHRRFLVTVNRGEPDWKLLGVPHVEQLPAVQWRLQNLEKMDQNKLRRQTDDLVKALGVED